MLFVRRAFSTVTESGPSSGSTSQAKLDIADTDCERITNNRKRELADNMSIESGASLPKKKKSSTSSLLGHLWTPFRNWFGVSPADSDSDDCEIIENENHTPVITTGRFAFPTYSLTAPDDTLHHECDAMFVTENQGSCQKHKISTPEICGSRLHNHTDVTVNAEELPKCDIVTLSDDDDDDEPEIVDEIHNSPIGTMRLARESLEHVMNEVMAVTNHTSNGLSCSSPTRSDSLSIISLEDSASPGPEDSVSRQNTPKGFYRDARRGDNWSRRRSALRGSSVHPPYTFSIEKASSRYFQSISNSDACDSPINLSARDRYKLLVSGAAKNIPLRNTHRTARKVPRKLKRLDSSDDYLRRARAVLNTVPIIELDCDHSVNRYTSGMDSGTNLCDLENRHSVLDGDKSVSRTPSRCDTPQSMFSSSSSAGREKVDDLMLKFREVELRDSAAIRQHSAYVSGSEHNKRREIELIEASRVCGLFRKANRVEIEEQTRQRLDLKGIRLPKPPPKPKNEFAELPDDVDDLCRRTWDPRNETTVFCKGFDQPITGKDLRSLAKLNWLNDEVINCYLQLICERSKTDEALPKVYAFNTFFYNTFANKGYMLVKRWTRKVDIFSYDIILIPVHVNGNHWCITIIDFGRKTIDYFDSLHGLDPVYLETVKRYLDSESMDKKKIPFDFINWICTIRQDCPEQLNGSDCGMFSCKFAEFASRRQVVVFNQGHMPYYRKRMVWEIVNLQLM